MVVTDDDSFEVVGGALEVKDSLEITTSLDDPGTVVVPDPDGESSLEDLVSVLVFGKVRDSIEVFDSLEEDETPLEELIAALELPDSWSPEVVDASLDVVVPEVIPEEET